MARLPDGRLLALSEPGFQARDEARLHLCPALPAQEGLPPPAVLVWPRGCLADGGRGAKLSAGVKSRGRYVPGYEPHACAAIAGDRVRHDVRWTERRMLPGGLRRFQIEFVLMGDATDALYGFALETRAGEPP